MIFRPVEANLGVNDDIYNQMIVQPKELEGQTVGQYLDSVSFWIHN